MRILIHRPVNLASLSAFVECVTAINVSVKDQLSLSISVAVGSTIVSCFEIIKTITLLTLAVCVCFVSKRLCS